MSIIGSNILAGASGQAGGGYEIERSVRFNSADSAHLSRTPASAGNRKTWTLSAWLKKCAEDTNAVVMSATGTPSRTAASLYSGNLYIYSDGGINVSTVGKFRDPSAWYHVVWVLDTTQATAADRTKIYVNGIQQLLTYSTSPGQNTDWGINNTAAHRIGSDAVVTENLNGYLADIHFIDGQALDPSSFGEFDTNNVWQPIDASGLTYGTNGFHLPFSNNSTAAALGTDTSGNGNTWTVNNLIPVSQGNGNYIASGTITGQGYANPGGINAAFDGKLTTYLYSSDAGTQRTTFTFGSPITVNTSLRFYAAANPNGLPGSTDGFYVNGVNYSTSLSSTYTWVTIPQATLSSFQLRNINSVYNAAVTAIEVDGVMLLDNSLVTGADNDSLVDSPTNGSQTDTGVGGEVVGNYCTWNPLDRTVSSPIPLANGNLDVSGSGSASEWSPVNGTIGMTSGKWYWEITGSGTIYSFIGIASVLPQDGTGERWPGRTSTSYGYYNSNGNKYNNNVSTAYGASYGSGDVVGVAFDADNRTLTFYKNGSSQGTAFTSIPAGTYFPCVSTFFTSATQSTNFGQRQWAYAAPAGFKALCTTNLPEPTIADGSTAMDVVTYTGNGSTQTISGLNFSPDLVWVKSRGSILVTANHNWFDAVRGVGKALFSDVTNAEINYPTQRLTAFTSDGFTVGPELSVSTGANVAWTWDAGSSTVSNTEGSITSSVRANASAGFSVVTYTGTGSSTATFGHGLGVTPGFFIIKNRSSSCNWMGYHSATGKDAYYDFNTTNAVQTTIPNIWGTSGPSSSLITVTGAYLLNNQSGQNYVCYAWSPVAGYSSFGSYTGNGSADGTFVYTGFRPRWILYKPSNRSGTDWVLWDTARNPYNIASNYLLANTSGAEGSVGVVDILSNGFKLRVTSTGNNGAGDQIIYAAFAEHPFATSRAR